MNVANTLSRCGSRMQHTVANFEVLLSCAFVYPFSKAACLNITWQPEAQKTSLCYLQQHKDV